jgi:hypothetical protein
VSHAAVDNRTPFALEVLFLVDESSRPLVVPVVKATFVIGRDGRCVRGDEQVPVNVAGACFGPDPAAASYKFEPEVAFTKPTTDVVLIGHAHAARPDTKEMKVSLTVASMSKEAIVYGDRLGGKTAGFFTMTRPLPFEKIPLIYERAFGGWDRSHADPSKHTYEPRNPVGTGFASAEGPVKELRLPNIEDPRSPFKNPGDRPAPVGFGFVSPHWQPRAALAGTYDEAWQKHRSPLLPADFDRRHFNAASAGLIMPKYLRGDEPISAIGVTPEGTLSFSLPGVPPPTVTIAPLRTPDQNVDLALDTVIIDADERRVYLIWRGSLVLRSGPHDVGSIAISSEPVRP